MTKFALVCYHPGTDDEEEELIEMQMESVPADLAFEELVFMCPKCRKVVLLRFDSQRLGEN